MATSIPALLVDLGPPQSNNVEVQSSCVAADNTCAKVPACPGSAPSCLPGIFGPTWSPDDGISALFGSSGPDAGAPVQGWTLAPGAPCTLALGGTPYGGVTTDAYGAMRSPATPTMGGVEYPGTPKCSAN
jgi:hypothetical protein